MEQTFTIPSQNLGVLKDDLDRQERELWADLERKHGQKAEAK